MHTIWTLPTGDNNFPTRWRQIKSLFTREWIASGGSESGVSLSQSKQGSRGVWQRRYFEKTIQNKVDLRRHLDYIHINPVKHRLCEKVSDWQGSSFHRYIRPGEYDPNWGGSSEFFGDEWNGYE